MIRAAPWDLAPGFPTPPASILLRLPSSAANPQQWRRPERQAPPLAAPASAGSTRRALRRRRRGGQLALGLKGRPPRTRRVQGRIADRGKGAWGFLACLFGCMVHRLGCTFLRTASATWLQRGCDGWSGKLKLSERESGGGNFSPCKVPAWSLPGAVVITATSWNPGRLSPAAGARKWHRSWLSLGLGIRGGRARRSLHGALSPH